MKRRKSSIVGNYLLNLQYHLLVLLLPLVTAPYLARVLGPEGNGAYSYVCSFATIINTAVQLGIYSYGNRQVAYVRDDRKKLSAVFSQLMTARLVLAVLGTVVYFTVVLSLRQYVLLFVLDYFYILASILDPTWLFVGVEDMKWTVAKNVVAKALAVAGIFLFVRDRGDVPVYVALRSGSVVLANGLAYIQVRRYVDKPHLDFSSFRKDIAGSAVLYLPSIAATIYTQCDKVLLGLLSPSSSQVAFYDYAEELVLLPLSFITTLSTVMMPRIAHEFRKKKQKSMEKLLGNAAAFSLFISIPMMFLLGVTAAKLIPWYLGEEFLPVVAAIAILSPTVVSNSLIGISGGQYLTATDQKKILLISNLVAVGANLVLDVLLIPLYGYRGAAAATLVSSFGCALGQFVYMQRQVRLKGLWGKTVWYVFTSVLMAFVVTALTREMKPTVLTTVIQIAIGAVTYLGLAFALQDEQVMRAIQNTRNYLGKRQKKRQMLKER